MPDCACDVGSVLDGSHIEIGGSRTLHVLQPELAPNGTASLEHDLVDHGLLDQVGPAFLAA